VEYFVDQYLSIIQFGLNKITRILLSPSQSSQLSSINNVSIFEKKLPRLQTFMGNTASDVTSGVKKQAEGDSSSQKCYELADLKGRYANTNFSSNFRPHS